MSEWRGLFVELVVRLCVCLDGFWLCVCSGECLFVMRWNLQNDLCLEMF